MNLGLSLMIRYQEGKIFDILTSLCESKRINLKISKFIIHTVHQPASDLILVIIKDFKEKS